MPEDLAIRIQNLTKTYRLYDSHADRVKEAFHPFRKKYYRTFNALTDVSFDVKRGETLGIIGRNGSGKSTLLQIICGTLQPTSGSIEVRGRVSALLELGAGFNPEFTGRQNLYINGAILGLKREEIESRFDDIAAFADIGDFIDQPVKTYSSGMYVRLAFAIAISVDPDILAVDEALAVGDIYYQHKCMHRMKELIQKGTTIVFVSHDMGSIKSLCKEAILLDNGLISKKGEAEEVVNEYYYQMIQSEPKEDGIILSEEQGVNIEVTDNSGVTARNIVFKRNEGFLQRTKDMRSGNGEVKIQNVELLNSAGNTITVCRFNEGITVRGHIEFFVDCYKPNVGFIVRDRNGIDIIGTNLFAEKTYLPRKKAGDLLVVDFKFR
ncbi:MAG TPA: ABC transporter ATP-binding protein, partial [Desulfatiglandales bacterium]|nr:ABC transporter ATP-binding protein [Desulfatiglandales bacterium]